MASSVTRSSRRAEGVHNQQQQQGRGDAAPDGGSHGRHKRMLDATERDLRPKKTRIAVDVMKPPVAPRLPDADLNASLTKHQAKVINGIRHELDRLQSPLQSPTRPATDTKEQGRKLRSQEATRFKSELSLYFADYDEVIGNDPKEQHLLNADTPIVIVDTKPQCVASPTSPNQPPASTVSTAIRGYGDSLFTDVFDAQRVDFGFLETQHNSLSVEDPLPDSMFEATHRRAERLERSIRNTEKGRAQHEKDQIIRLLHGLQGHDWLRVMGVSGITETKKKTFEPARAHFIRGCQNILDKFRNWSHQEKRRKQERERTLAERASEDRKTQAANDSIQDKQQATEGPITGRAGGAESEEAAPVHGENDKSETPSPAKQLRQEAMARSRLAGKRHRISARAPKMCTPPPLTPEREFRSFFSKKYERDNALNRHRRTGRKILAWGLAVPDFVEADFDLPEEYRDEETLRLRERRKRRDKRSKRQ
ncbi:hypothetical protein CDD81_7835 [Ophiocordyceps australis]|uniref:Something about silencing protein 4 domain-containing protein n=1 Tax=Ophiocordyceps australis TaxID=1399860 RepID=A0A2C5YG15_9HYPO|nr:hypothetical protein CDD81_7835 [Ophiocordyceps australis]